MRTLILAAALAAAAVSTSSAQQTATAVEGAALAGFSLTDQHGRAWSIDATGSEPVVIIFASRHESADAEAWSRQLSLLGSARVFRVLDVSGESSAWKQGLRKAMNDMEPIAVDWDGSIAKQIGRTPGKAAVIAVRGGKVVTLVEGPVAAPQYASLLSGLKGEG